jgi:integrase
LSLDKELGRHVDSKTDAYTEADRIKVAIRAGAFRRQPVSSGDRVGLSPTLEQLGTVYFTKYVNPKTGGPLSRDERYRWDLVMRAEVDTPAGRVRLGGLHVEDVTRHHLQAFLEAQRTGRTERITDAKGITRQCHRGGTISTNRCLERLRAFYTWAIENEYVSATPFKRGTAATIKLPREYERDRRLQPDHGDVKSEEERLLAAASLHLRALILAALETGCRSGELLSLQWHQVRWDLNEIHLPAAKTKMRRQLDVPMTPNLRALLEMRRHDPTGAEHHPDAYVFGNELGERIGRVRRAWEGACRRAGIVGLHFHDLRREAGSRMLEGGVPEHVVQRMLGHANLATTSRYLKTTRRVMQDAMRKYAEHRESCKIVASESANAVSSEQRPASEAAHNVLQ